MPRRYQPAQLAAGVIMGTFRRHRHSDFVSRRFALKVSRADPSPNRIGLSQLRRVTGGGSIDAVDVQMPENEQTDPQRTSISILRRSISCPRGV